MQVHISGPYQMFLRPIPPCPCVQDCSQLTHCTACIHIWHCPEWWAGHCIRPCRTPQGLQGATSKACQDPCVWHPFPPLCQLQHTAWCHVKHAETAHSPTACATHKVAKWYPSTDLWRTPSSLISTWTLSHQPQQLDFYHPAISLFKKWSTYQTFVSLLKRQKHCVGQYQKVCTSPGRWHLLFFTYLDVFFEDLKSISCVPS